MHPSYVIIRQRHEGRVTSLNEWEGIEGIEMETVEEGSMNRLEYE